MKMVPNDSGTGCNYTVTENNIGYPYIGDVPYWRENNLPSPWNQPGDFPYYPPKDMYPERIWPQIYPREPIGWPQFDPDAGAKILEEYIKQMKENKKPEEYPKDKVRHSDWFTAAEGLKNHRSIDIVVTNHKANEIIIKVKNNIITVAADLTKTGGKWPQMDFYQFNIDDAEEIISAKIANAVLTILIKNNYVAPKETIVPITE